MISDTKCQFFLRTLLQDAVAAITSKTYMQGKVPTVNYENIVYKQVPKGVIIREEYVSVTNSGFTSDWEQGSSFYSILVFDDKDSGIRARQVVDDICSFFGYGEYRIDNETFGIVITRIEVGKMLSYKDSDKIFIPIDIYFSKIS